MKIKHLTLLLQQNISLFLDFLTYVIIFLTLI